MGGRIVVCADGTWNRPEEDVETDTPTNVLRMARAIRPIDDNGRPQQVFYDWGVGSYSSKISGGIAGRGIHKNIKDAYRYIIQNYEPGAEIFLFGYSRGAYTIRSLCGLINNCGILKRPDAALIEQAFDNYKKVSATWAPQGEAAVRFRERHAHPSREIAFAGAWDTVGSLGIPFSVLGLFDRTDEFYDTKLGPNIRIARHALAIDERREDFEPTLWQPRDGLDLEQVWFAGVHGDIGGDYEPDEQGRLTSDFPLQWMMEEATAAGLALEAHLPEGLNASVRAPVHRSVRHIYRFRGKEPRPLERPGRPTRIHRSVTERWQADAEYRPENLRDYLDAHGWPADSA